MVAVRVWLAGVAEALREGAAAASLPGRGTAHVVHKAKTRHVPEHHKTKTKAPGGTQGH